MKTSKIGAIDIGPAEVLELPVDIIVPAALGNAINAENATKICITPLSKIIALV